jgi:hypothetical protein
MSRVSRLALAAALTTAGLVVSARTFHAATASAPVVSREIIAVYLGTDGTDAESGMISVVRDMRTALARQAASMDRHLVLRGVSLEPSVDGGLQHLVRFGFFDEVSVGGNWTNSAVVRYLGGSIGTSRTSSIPQVVLLEREIQQDASALLVGPERELARYIGTREIGEWVRRGAPLPR